MAGGKPFYSPFLSTVWTLLWAGASIVVGTQVSSDPSWLASLQSLPSFLSIPLQSQTEAPIISTLAGVLSGFLFFFAVAYLGQALLDTVRLGLVNLSLGRAARKGRFARSDPSAKSWWFYGLFSSLWYDFTGTLHRQRDADGSIIHRATVPIELHFSDQALVDGPMRVDFFRHLPGILTGAGIVSTFAGILLGLTEFDPTVDATQVTTQLKQLFVGVSTAFVASFFAIFAAIVVTVIEKLVAQLRYAQASSMRGRLEELFKGGVEPEYLARMAISGEASRDVSAPVAQSIQVDVPVDKFADVVAARFQETGANIMSASSRAATDQTSAITTLSERLVAGHERLAALLQQILSTQGSSIQAAQAAAEHASKALARQEAVSQSQLTPEDLAALGGKLEGAFGELARVMQTMTEEMAAGRKTMEASFDRLVTLAEQQNMGLREGFSSLGVGLQDNLTALSAEVRGDIGGLGEGVRQDLGGLGAGVREDLSGLGAGMRENLATLGAGMREGFSTLGSGMREGFSTLGSGMQEGFSKLDEDLKEVKGGLVNLEKGVEHGEAIRQGLGTLATVVQGEGEKVREAAAAWQAADQERQQEVLKKMQEGNQALGDRFQESFKEALENPVQTIVSRVQEASERQEETARHLHADLLNAFTVQLQNIVGDLISNMTRMTERISQERQAMEISFRRLVEGLAAAAKEGGDGLAGQLEKVMALAETRQDQMIEALTEFTTQMRSDLNLVEGRLNAASRDSAEELKKHSETLAGIVESETEEKMRALTTSLGNDMKGALQQLAAARAELTEKRDVQMLERIAASNTQMMDEVRDSLLSGLAGSVKVMSESVNRASEVQAHQSKELSDLLLASLTGKVEESFGGLSKGLSELRERLQNERDTIKEALTTWVDQLEKANREDSAQVAEKLKEAMQQADERHNGMIGALNQFSRELAEDMGKMGSDILRKNEETAGSLQKHLEEVVNATGREQSAFIEILGERLNTLRTRLKIKE